MCRMKIDMHVHTNRFSMCSVADPEAVVREAVSRGLDGLVFTEHNTFWPPDALKELRESYPDIKLFNGAEIDVPSLHHVLTILPDPEPEVLDPAGPDRFRELVDERGGVTIAAHPFRFFRDYARRNRDFPLDAVEIASGNMTDPEMRQRSIKLAEDWGSKQVASSDAHSLDPVGQFYTELPGTPETEAELIEVLKSKTVTPKVIGRGE